MCLVTLSGGGKFEIKQKKYRLTEEQKQMEGSLLFDFCADSLSAFLESARAEGTIKEGAELPMGFTVSWSDFAIKYRPLSSNYVYV